MKGSYVFMAYDPFSSDLITRPRKSTPLELAITPRNFGYPLRMFVRDIFHCAVLLVSAVPSTALLLFVCAA